jgi:PKD repeat protein
VNFEGDIQPGTGSEQVVYTWDFGDGSEPVDAQDVQHTFAQPGVFQVSLTVTSAPCPIQKQLTVVRTITVGSGVPNVLLPLVMKTYSGN